MAISVLVVEDDSNISQLLQLYLEKEGYAVTLAADGGQGLAKFHAIKPDLVLLDVMMPVMDGWAVCRAIRAEGKTPVIMLTAKSETDDKVSGLKDAIRVLDGVKDIAVCRLTSADVVRHALVQQIINAYEQADKKKELKKPEPQTRARFQRKK